MNVTKIAGDCSSDSVILFFNGWGMDASVVSHLDSNGFDVWTINDYRVLDSNDLNIIPFDAYKKIYVVAWSLGVCMANYMLVKRGLKIERAVAVNGTNMGIHDKYGIPQKGYMLTEEGILKRGCDKFISRMFCNADDLSRFKLLSSSRTLQDQQEELSAIRVHILHKKCVPIKWNRAVIAVNDIIFPTQNVESAWELEDDVEVVTLSCGHFPFFQYKDWRGLLW